MHLCKLSEGLQALQGQVHVLKLETRNPAALPEWLSNLVHLEDLQLQFREPKFDTSTYSTSKHGFKGDH